MHLRGQSAPRAPKRLAALFFGAPAACEWAHTRVLSTSRAALSEAATRQSSAAICRRLERIGQNRCRILKVLNHEMTATTMNRGARLIIHLALTLALAGTGLAPYAAEPAVSAGAPASTFAGAEGEIPGTRVELQELKRNGDDTLTLSFALINNSDKPLKFGYDFVEKGKNVQDFGSIGGVHLIDGAGKKKYLVLRDSEDIPLCSRGLGEIAPKSRITLWAKFPAPPEDVRKISVIIPHFLPLDGVPISQ